MPRIVNGAGQLTTEGDTMSRLTVTVPAWKQIAYARKEIAFEQWRASGYRDLKAYTLYIHWYHICNGTRKT